MLADKKFDFRFDCGYAKPLSKMTLDDKSTFIKSIWLHYVFCQPHAELQQLRRGIYNTICFDCIYPNEIWHLFAASRSFDVTPEYLCEAFVIHYSPDKSNNRIKEETIIVMWYEYIDDSFSRPDMQPRDILKFLTGLSKIPAAGFTETPKIYFTDEDCLPFG